MAPPNPNDWHWVDRSVYDWTREWLDETLPKISAEDGDASVNITKVIRMSDKEHNDILLMQRKKKAIVVYDIQLTLGFSAAVPEEEDISGEINVIEFDSTTKEADFEVCQYFSNVELYRLD